MNIYATYYQTRRMIVSVTRDRSIVDIIIYDKTGEEFSTLAESTYSNVSDLQALKLTRKQFGL